MDATPEMLDWGNELTKKFNHCVFVAQIPVDGTATHIRPIDEMRCREFGRLPARNRQGCCGTSCKSPWRYCIICLDDGERDPGTVVDPLRGLCSFHKEFGDNVKKKDGEEKVRIYRPQRVELSEAAKVALVRRHRVTSASTRVFARSEKSVAVPHQPVPRAHSAIPSLPVKIHCSVEVTGSTLDAIAQRKREAVISARHAQTRVQRVATTGTLANNREEAPEAKNVSRSIGVVEKESPVVLPSVSIAEVPVYERRRRRKSEKLTALEAAASDLHTKGPVYEVRDLLAEVAKRLRMTETGFSAFFYSLPESERTRFLYGEGGKKIMPRERKFGILLELRNRLRMKGLPAPTKAEFAILAAPALGMTENSTRNFLYEKLTEEQDAALEFGLPLNATGLSKDEQFAILKKVREEMRAQGKPAPLQIELAEAAAPLLRQKVGSVRSVIVDLSEAQKAELQFAGCRSWALHGIDRDDLKAGFLGAIAVLKLRKKALTRSNLRQVLHLKQAIVESYLQENRDIASLLIG